MEYLKILQAMMGNNPYPYMSLDIKNGLKNQGKRLRNRWDEWAWNNLPQAPGMQPIMFQQLDETDPNTWAMYNRAGY